MASSSEVAETVITAEEVAPSTNTSTSAEQTTETSSAVAEAVSQATIPTEKQETQASPQAESTVEETTTPAEETAIEATATSSEEAKEVTPTVSTYQPEETKMVSTTYAAPAAPDYAGLAVAKSENAVFNHKQLPLKKKLLTCLASHPLVVTVQETVEITEKVWLSTLWYQKAQN